MKKKLLTILLIILPILAKADAVEIKGIYYNLIEKANIAEVTKHPEKYNGNVIIPESIEYEGIKYSVTKIGESAFQYCSSLTSVTIPNSVTSIGNFAFEYCSSLTSVTIPNSVTSIDIAAFNGCSSLTSVTIPNSVTSIGKGAFFNCSSLTSVDIPNSVTSIGESAFMNCKGLTSVTIPNSVTSIGESAFDSCSSLTSVAIPNSVTSIGKKTFYGCSSLTSVTIPNSVKSIGESAFYNCKGLTSVTIPNSVTSIDISAFFDCSSLTSVTIPNSVKSIGNCAFSLCSSLTTVAIPNSLTRIENATFSDCSSLNSVTIPNSVASIGERTFQNCSSLTSVTIGSRVSKIGISAFGECKELKDVYCYAVNVPSTDNDAFKDSYIEYVTLHVPSSSVSAYKAANPWKDFKQILAIEGGYGETKKCVKPTISYKNGELAFYSETEGVEYIYEITDTDIKKGYEAKVKLGVTYNISVYATKAGYDNSDTATATLCWIDADPKTEGISNGVAAVRAMPVMIQSQGGILNITGAPEGSVINVYDLSGKMVESAISDSETTSIPTNLKSGEIGIVKIGDKSIKVVMQ